MIQDLVPVPRVLPSLPAVSRVDVLAAFRKSRKATTLKAYDDALADFGRYCGVADSSAAVELLLGLVHGQANAVALGYRDHLELRGLKPATVAVRLAALRSLVKLGRQLGVITWSLDVQSPHVQSYRDTAGPGLDGWTRMLGVALGELESRGAVGIRDLAILRLLYDLGLRRGEIEALNAASVDLGERQVIVIGKGHDQGLAYSLPDPTWRALAAWLDWRGFAEGPLFVRLDPGVGVIVGDGFTRLTSKSIYKMVRQLAERAGLKKVVSPHRIRHTAITRVLVLSGGDLPNAQRFSRHADVRTLMIYDDRRRDRGGELAKLLANETPS
jgi:integrase/recombinase XerC